MNSNEQAWLYLVSGGGSGLVRLGVASDPRKRLRELQVGSPVALELAGAWLYPKRLDAEAIVEELQRRFADRRVRGRWYRLGVVDVRSALANPATPAAAAAARAAAAAEAAECEARLRRRRGRHSRARTEKELEYQRRRRRARQGKQRRAARLRARAWPQTEVAAAVGVTARTLRNWKHDPGFERALARERERAAQQTATALPTTPGPVRRRTPRKIELPLAPRESEPTGGSRREPEQPDPEAAEAFAEIEARRLDSHEAWLDSNQARRGELTPTQIRAHERQQRQRDRSEGGRIKPVIRW